MAKGKTREKRDFVKKTGLFEGEVVAINPSKEKLEKLLNVELENEIEYTSTEEVNGKSIARAQIVFWLKDVAGEDGAIRSVHFFLKDVERENVTTPEELAAGTKVRKKQYINNLGMTAWADKEENLPDWFKNRKYRVAMVGEEELYTFVSAWLSDLDRKDEDASLISPFEKLIKGNVSELTCEMKGEYDETVACLVVIRTVEKDGEVKEYEQVYNRAFMPGFAMKLVRTKKVDADFIKKAGVTERRKRNVLQRFVLGVTDPTYGIKDHYTLGELEDYDPTKNPVKSGKVLTEEDTEY